MKRLFLIFSICLMARALFGQGLAAASKYITTPVATNAWVALPLTGAPVGSRLFTVIVENSAAADTWVQIFDTNGVPANGTAVHVTALPVQAGKVGYYDFGVYGLPLTNGLCIANSTTDRTLTNSTATLIITAVYNPRP